MSGPGAAELAEIMWLTLRVTLAATAIGAIVGVPLGVLLVGRARATSRVFRLLVYALYALPPIVAGLIVYALLSRAGPLGGLGLLFTPTAIVFAESLLTIPLVAGLTVAALADVPRPVREAIEAAGAVGRVAKWALVREARFGIMAAIMVAFGRAVAEVAAALLVGGNVRHETRTMGTAIVQEVSQGRFGFAFALGGALLGLALITVLVLSRLQSAEAEGRR